MAREDLDAVAELHEPLQGVKEAFGADRGLDREVGSRCIAHEERVAGEHEPWLVEARAVADGERAMLGAVPRGVDRPQRDIAELDLRTFSQRIVLEARAGLAVHADGHAVLECQAPVAGDVIGMRMGLENDDDLDLVPLGGIQILLDRVGRIDDRRHAGSFVADEVGSASEVVVDELPEQHARDATNRCGYIS